MALASSVAPAFAAQSDVEEYNAQIMSRDATEAATASAWPSALSEVDLDEDPALALRKRSALDAIQRTYELKRRALELELEFEQSKVQIPRRCPRAC